ncbi:sugar kinase [Fertoebacter nigrum]|uniref:Sugar kinase n=1 Tax=Fertoeibacter niger TaxID=2656921 RepID=A0A8X8GRV4_9RHOB|nr:sugar kinase [Fertoeibacter niger]NUB43209.1 sugar kinase [Fertoeibacter niger]
MPRFVSVGECMVELAPLATEGQFAMGFAGDTFNTAWYARRCLAGDWTVDYVTALGTDPLSGRMVDFMADAGIGTGHVARLPGRTPGLYMIELVKGERSFSYWRGQSAARELAGDAAVLDAAFDGAGVVYFSGITLAILPPEDRTRFLAAVAAARGAGALVVFDPNLRPRLWPDTAMMCARVMQAAAMADIALPSHDDEAVHFGDADLAATAARYAAAGVPLVVVKNGAGQMLTLDRGQEARHAPVQVSQVVDSTAAGDSFNAGFLAAHLAGEPLAAAVRRGAALAARVLGAKGALVAVQA